MKVLASRRNWDGRLVAAGSPPTIQPIESIRMLIVRLYRKLGYSIERLRAPRMISCTGNRTPASEVLATRGF